MAAFTSLAASVVATGVSIGMSVDQANKAAAERRKAQKAAEESIAEAIRETEIMPMQELALDLAAYEQAREAQNVAAATAIDAARQGEGRGLAAAVGRAQMANIQGQQAIRAQQGREMMELEKIKAEERAAASDARKNLALGEAEGAAAAAADAAARQRMAEQQAAISAVHGVTQAFQTYADLQGPFDKRLITENIPPEPAPKLEPIKPITSYQLPTTDTSGAPAIPQSPYQGISIYSVLGPDGYPMQAPVSPYLPTQPLGVPQIQ